MQGAFARNDIAFAPDLLGKIKNSLTRHHDIQLILIKTLLPFSAKIDIPNDRNQVP